MYKASKYIWLALAAVALICGSMITFNPAGFANSVCRMVGILSLIGGVMRVIDEHNSRTPMGMSTVILLTSGALLLIAPGMILRFISIFAGIALISFSIPRLRNALDDKKLGAHGWEVMLGLSVGGVAIGALLILGGASLANIIVRILGIALIAIGGWMAYTTIRKED